MHDMGKVAIPDSILLKTHAAPAEATSLAG
jgi:response regulator RpfG family c-di-GMP phosphodiesterase